MVTCLAALAITQVALTSVPRAEAQAQGSTFDLVTLAYGLEQPTAAAWLPDGRLLVTEKEGRLHLVEPDGSRTQVLDISDHVVNERERGLFDLEVDTDFARNGFVYLLYTYKVNPFEVTGPQAIRLTRVSLDAVGNVTGPERVILGRQARAPCPLSSRFVDCIPSFDNSHQGGTVVSDPRNGTLWVTTGDSNEPTRANNGVFRVWDPNSLSGKVLHVDRAGRGLRRHPFCPRVRRLNRVCTKIHARGFRNPFRLVLRGGRRLPLISDVGWATREEIDLLKPGRNYGWPCFEGSLRTPVYRDKNRCQAAYADERSATRRRWFQRPLYEYGNRGEPGGKGLDQAAVLIGPQYRSGPYPAPFQGKIFFGDYAAQFIKMLHLNRKGTRVRRVKTLIRGVTPVDFALTPRRTVSYVDFLEGEVRELVHRPLNKTPTARITASPTSGSVPLVVEFDAGDSSDPDLDSLSYEWDFGDGTPAASGVEVTHAYSDAGRFQATLTVRDPGGLSSSRSVTIHAGNTAPMAAIDAPSAGAAFTVGKPVSLVAHGSDAEDGALPSGAFKWSVVLVHRSHGHPLGLFRGAIASFLPVSDHDADSHYTFTLSVTDSQGLTTTLAPRAVHPRTVSLVLRSRPRGVRLGFGERSYRAPAQIVTAVGYRPLVTAPLVIRRKQRRFRFVRWSHGARRVHAFRVPESPVTLVARYRRIPRALGPDR